MRFWFFGLFEPKMFGSEADFQNFMRFFAISKLLDGAVVVGVTVSS